MTPQEERAIAQGYAERIAKLLNEIDGSHGLIVYTDGGALVLEGKYGVQAVVLDTITTGWIVK